MRLGVVVVTHGQLATELVNSAEMIVGDLPHFTAVSIGWHEDVEQARQGIGRAIERVGRTAEGEVRGVLVLTDMFGGTPANLALTFLDERIEVVTGVNLPMLMKLATCRGPDARLEEVAKLVASHGQKNITLASELLRARSNGTPSPKDKAKDQKDR